MKPEQIKNLFLALLLLVYSASFAQVKRSRGEDLPGILSSNTIGFGNLWGHLESSVREHDGAIRIEPNIRGEIGLSELMALQVGMVPFERGIRNIIGKTEAKLKLTFPGNDNLRPFGLGGTVNLVLSTEEDTFSFDQDTSRPAYPPTLGFSLAADFDLVKMTPNFPIKFYANFTTIDYDRFLPMYKQMGFRGALEFKEIMWSAFAIGRLALYKEKRTRENLNPGKTYNQKAVILGTGFRYRFLKFWKIPLRSLSTAFYIEKKIWDQWNPSQPSYPDFLFSFSAQWSPFFRETQAEVIRSTLMAERRKGPRTKSVKREKTEKKNSRAGFLGGGDNPDEEKRGRVIDGKEFEEILGEEDEALKKQREIETRRKKIHEELEKIEELID